MVRYLKKGCEMLGALKQIKMVYCGYSKEKSRNV
jgi:hypothetical protein